jgi:hypothetical protein
VCCHYSVAVNDIFIFTQSTMSNRLVPSNRFDLMDSISRGIFIHSPVYALQEDLIRHHEEQAHCWSITCVGEEWKRGREQRRLKYLFPSLHYILLFSIRQNAKPICKKHSLNPSIIDFSFSFPIPREGLLRQWGVQGIKESSKGDGPAQNNKMSDCANRAGRKFSAAKLCS